jgi:4-amino-4-deoxy-L-arabinose transferase-like glycosyltransferase
VPRRTWILVLAIAAAAALLRAAAFAGLDLYTDEAYYWLWSLRPAAGYFDHPPLVAWTIWLSSRLWPGEAGVRLLFVLSGALTVVFAALAAFEMERGPRAPLLAAVLAAGAPLLHVAGAMALPDGPLAAAFAASLWLLSRARGPGWLWAGLAVGLALQAKYSAALLAPALLGLVAWDRGLRRELRTPWPWLGAALAILIFAPNLAWNAGHDFIAIRYQLRHGFRTGTSLRTFAEYLGGLWGGAGLVALPVGLWAGLRARSPEERRVAAVLVTVAVTTWSATRGKVEANWAVQAYPGLAALAGAWLARRPGRRGPVLAGAQAALGMLVLAVFAAEMRHPRLLAGSRTLARFHAGRGLGETARRLSAQACREVGDPPGCQASPFVYPSSYQYAGHYGYYAGWTRLGPAEERPSQLDIWAEKPRPGEPFLYAGQEGEPGELFRRDVRDEGEGPTIAFEVRFAGQVVRTGTVKAFTRFTGGGIRRESLLREPY